MKIEWCCNVRYMDINPGFRKRLSAMDEEIRVVTWQNGSRGFRAYRDFEILAGDELMAPVATLWLYVDLKKKRPRRIPPEWPQAFTIEMDAAVDGDVNAAGGQLTFAVIIAIDGRIIPGTLSPRAMQRFACLCFFSSKPADQMV